jgi:hypothetical protein
MAATGWFHPNGSAVAFFVTGLLAALFTPFFRAIGAPMVGL